MWHIDGFPYVRTMETNTALSIWDDTGVVDELDLIINKYGVNDFNLVMAQIPALFGTSHKATYLGFRAVGLTTKQALSIIGLDDSILTEWYTQTPELRTYETEYLADLQIHLGANIVRLGFLRNMTMFLFRDQLIARKSFNMESMTDREFTYLRTTRRFYGTSDLLALEKAINPEKHKETNFILSFGQNRFEIIDNNPETITLEVEDEHTNQSDSGGA